MYEAVDKNEERLSAVATTAARYHVRHAEA
jgi:hypothetical protein